MDRLITRHEMIENHTRIVWVGWELFGPNLIKIRALDQKKKLVKLVLISGIWIFNTLALNMSVKVNLPII